MSKNEYEVPEEIKITHPEDVAWWEDLVLKSRKRGCLSCIHRLPSEEHLLYDSKIAPWYRDQAKIRCAYLGGEVVEQNGSNNGNHSRLPLLPNKQGIPSYFDETFIKPNCLKCSQKSHKK